MEIGNDFFFHFVMQSSWTKCAAEVDSPQPMSNSDQLADPPDSTCALVIDPATGTFCKGQVPKHLTGEKQGKKKLSGKPRLLKLISLLYSVWSC